MKLSHVTLCGFRSYRQHAHIEFAPGFTVVDGRNGVGKSTLFDAVEYALTGTIGKYLSATADKESVHDYVWWTGEGDAPPERFVEVGFVGDDGVPVVVRRTEFGGADEVEVDALVSRLTIPGAAPSSPLRQLCDVAIIRDEHIAHFSLDLPEADRYTLLRQALGATDADDWIGRGADLEKAAKAAARAADATLATLRQNREEALKRVDEARQSLQSDAALAAATERLQAFVDAPALVDDDLVARVRTALSDLGGRAEALGSFLGAWPDAQSARDRLAVLDDETEAATEALALADDTLARLLPRPDTPSSQTTTTARQLADLAALGRRLGLQSGACPLCGCDHADEQAFLDGIAAAEAAAGLLSEAAVEQARREQARADAEAAQSAAARAVEHVQQRGTSAREIVDAFDQRRVALGLGAEASADDVRAQVVTLNAAAARAGADLRTLATAEFDELLQREEKRAETASQQLEAAEQAAGRARRAATTAKTLHDAARRAVNETLNERLGRVQPLMSDLYQRLNPHPVWKELDYSIRGDVKRFMTLQVGGKHNPQFIFSSGQRRATGLAFLLSVNLSLAWSRWKTILLDDPVQHVDDFRAVHLAEVMGQLVRDGRQIVCAVEDAALADLLCRRLPNEAFGAARRVTLRLEPDGSSAVDRRQVLPPLARHTVTPDPFRQMAG